MSSGEVIQGGPDFYKTQSCFSKIPDTPRRIATALLVIGALGGLIAASCAFYGSPFMSGVVKARICFPLPVSILMMSTGVGLVALPVILYTVKNRRVGEDLFYRNVYSSPITGENPFDQARWAEKIGPVQVDGAMPQELVDELDKPCPFANRSGVLVKHTHALFLIPPSVDRKPLNLSFIQGLSNEFLCNQDIHDLFGEDSITEQPYWLLIPNASIPKSLGGKQGEKLEKMAQKYRYEVPSALEVALCAVLGENTTEEGTETEYLCRVKQELYGLEYRALVARRDNSVSMRLEESDRTFYGGLAPVKRFPATSD